MKVLYTVPSNQSRVAYSGNGSTQVFSVPYVFFDDSDLVVTSVITATGEETVKVLTTDYTVSGGDGSSGSVTMLTAPAVGTTLVINRSIPYTQEIDYQANDGFPAEVNEEGLDRGTMLAQQVKALVDRALKIPITETEVPSIPPAAVRALKYLSFDSLGNPTVGVPEGSGGAIVSAAMEPVVAAATVEAALVALSSSVDAAWGIPAFAIKNTDGSKNGFVFQQENNQAPGSPGAPVAITGYGKLTTTNNAVWGIFGRADLLTPGIFGAAVNEFNTVNMAGAPVGAMPPTSISAERWAIAVQAVAFGDFNSLAGLAVLKAGGPAGIYDPQAFLHGIYVAPGAADTVSLFLDAASAAGPSLTAALIKSKASVPNMILQTAGNQVAANSVLQIMDKDGTVWGYMDQGGNLITRGTGAFLGNTAPPAGGNATTGITFSNVSAFGIFFGTGAPTFTAAKGSMYLRRDGSTTNDRTYINTDGSTTWTYLTTGA